MIRLTIDGHEHDIAAVEFHYQDDVAPGGHTYRLFIDDKEFLSACNDFLDVMEREGFSRKTVAPVLEFVRGVAGMRHGRKAPGFWINQITLLERKEGCVVLGGPCSPNQ